MKKLKSDEVLTLIDHLEELIEEKVRLILASDGNTKKLDSAREYLSKFIHSLME